MSETIFIGVAWPYANGPLHLGHVAGACLPPDIFARYHRTKGDRVLMVSGSDQHGTPITVAAEREGKTPQELAETYHRSFLDCWQKLGISFDLFTSTGTANHRRVVQDIFNKLLSRGHIYQDIMTLTYCPNCQRFLPDRYVEGTCPFCGFTDARGDQCDKCGKPLNPMDLIEAHCKLCGARPVERQSEHFFLKLSAFEGQLLEWLKQQAHWRANVLNFSLRYVSDGLRDRAITRDIDWGVPVPVAGFESKRIYVWFEAVIGYLSASQEWAQAQGDPEAWRAFWQGDAKSYYFIGKDNIPFHTIIWPAILMGYGGLNLPYDVPANEFLTLQGKQLSTSRHWAVWLPDYLERYDPDPLRYLLSINMPETSDTDFSWNEFHRRNNDELVATYGNLVHRVLTFIQRNLGAAVPAPGELAAVDNALLTRAEKTLEDTDRLLHGCRFRDAIRTAFGLAQEVNRYLDDRAPWRTIKQDRAAAATACYTALGAISCLKTVLYPFLPFSSQKLHSLLGLEGTVEEAGWRVLMPSPGTALPQPSPLFSKLDDSIVEEEAGRLAAGRV